LETFIYSFLLNQFFNTRWFSLNPSCLICARTHCSNTNTQYIDT